MAKLKEREFYNVSLRKKEIVPAEYIEVVRFKNGAYSLLGLSKDNMKIVQINFRK